MLEFAGAWTLSDPPVFVKFSGTKRWFWSKVWVSEPRRTIDTLVMLSGATTPTEKVLPCWTVEGADSTVGQLTAPLTGLQKEAAGWEAAARAQSRRDFDDSAEPTAATPSPASDHFFQIATRAHPGAKAPLGWVLSKAARDDLRDQLEVNRAEILRLRRVLDGRAARTCPASGVGG